MASVLCHRGPDGSGFYTDSHASLGHRRLSIIDVDGGNQPILNEDQSIVVVFNGEIYNFTELRQKLRRKGHAFSTRSDTEVLVHLYEDMGPDFIHELNGMFAFAMWDSRKKVLVAARDRMGEKPFYYRVGTDGTLSFASELKALLVAFDQPAEVSSASIADYLSYGYVPSPYTIYEGIHKLPPAHRLIWNDGELTVEPYWSPQTCQQDDSYSEAVAIAELENHLKDSVRLRLRSDVPIGAFLSGGIDSSLIVGIASQIHHKPLQTYVIGFQESRFDESDYAQQVAKIFGTHHHHIHVDDLSLECLPELVHQFDEPFADPSSLPTYYVTRAASQNLKVCLSGDGADELFGGYNRYLPHPFEIFARRALPDHFRHTFVRSLAESVPDFLPGAGLLGRLASDGTDHYHRKIGVFTSSEIRNMLPAIFFAGAQTHDNFLTRFFSDTRYSDIQSRLRADQETYLPEDILVKVDRTSMLNSLEVRTPFLDHNLVDFANRLPMTLKIRRRSGKYLLKQLLRRMIPDTLVDRPKHGFSLPIRMWFRDRYADLLADHLLPPNSRVASYIDPDSIRQTYNTHKSGARDRSAQLWALLWLEIWLEQHSERSATKRCTAVVNNHESERAIQ